jgi:SAM-dependent methyltransferase
MKRQNLRHFHCPKCKSGNLSIAPEREENEEVMEGDLRCGDCGASYRVKSSIPRFVPQDNYAESFGFQWTIHEKTQLDSYTGLPVSRKRLFDVTGWPADMSGQVILEAGSGAGRFTEILLETRARVFSLDYSCAVESNWRNNGQSGNLQLFQGDLRNIPLERASFDKVLCLGVLQHTPSPEMAFKSLSEMVRPGGELVVDVYRRDVLALLQWKYVLRPITKRMSQPALYRLVSRVVPFLLPAAKKMRKIGGRVGARIVPIVEYSHLGLPDEQNQQWAILDTFDMYSPSYDYPQNRQTLERWYMEAGFEDVSVLPGPNGLVGKGRRKALDAGTHLTGIDRSKCAELSA